MKEAFTNPAPDAALPVPAVGQGTLDMDVTAAEWHESGTPGFRLKPMLENRRARLKTWLMQVDAGAYSPMHRHEDVEQIYVLEGTFYDQHKTYGPGSFVVRAPYADHEAGSKTGALMIVTYAPGPWSIHFARPLTAPRVDTKKN